MSTTTADGSANDPVRILETTETPNLETDGRAWVTLWVDAGDGALDAINWHGSLGPHGVVNLLIDALTRVRLAENPMIIDLYRRIAEGVPPPTPIRKRKGAKA